MQIKHYFFFLILLGLVSCSEKYKLEVDTFSEMDGEFIGTNVLSFDLKASTREEAIKEAKSTCHMLFIMYESAHKSGSYASQPTAATIYNKDRDIVEYIDLDSEDIKPTREVVIDSAKIEILKSRFEFKKDEFSTTGATWIRPKSAPKYINRNGIFCYFKKAENEIGDLRLQIQYHADNWLFIKKYGFSIDGDAYEFTPKNVETDSGNGGKIWEWVDIPVTNQNLKNIVNALSKAKTVKIKFYGTQYYDVRTVTSKEIQSIFDTIELYKAMGGEFEI